MEDIKIRGKMEYLCLSLLSRFARNAADVLSHFRQCRIMELIYSRWHWSSKDAGKLLISVLSALHEIERRKHPYSNNGRSHSKKQGRKMNGGLTVINWRRQAVYNEKRHSNKNDFRPVCKYYDRSQWDI